MRKRDTFDVICSLAAVLTDAAGLYGSFILAWRIRFYGGWIPAPKGIPRTDMYVYGAAIATMMYLLIYRLLDLYHRPQSGSFIEKIPRLVHANLVGMLLIFTLASVIRSEPPVSRLTVGIAFLTTCYVIILLRFLLFNLEIVLARLRKSEHRVAIIGTDHIALRLSEGLEQDPRQHSRVVGFFPCTKDAPDLAIPPGLVYPRLKDLERLIKEKALDEVILTDMSLPRSVLVKIMSTCEKHLVIFQLVPDMFRLLTSSVTVQSINGITLLGVGQWPLDRLVNRVLKRTTDIAGAVTGLCLASWVIAMAAVLIKWTSPGPVFFRQARCGEGGRQFTMVKLRSMPVDAEDQTGPVMTTAGDQRPTRVGKILRQTNLDELPQLWNVLKGDMSLVGPRPERPHFVDQFKEDIGQYMWRHMYRPGMTGWAQVNGLRGETSIEERIKYDLYYLERWSLALDLKILLLTLFTRENAY